MSADPKDAGVSPTGQAVNPPSHASLVAFARQLGVGQCACRSCQVLLGSLAIADRTRPADASTENVAQEAVGLMKAALVVILRHAAVSDITVGALVQTGAAGSLVLHTLATACEAFGITAAVSSAAVAAPLPSVPVKES